jgi:hypothetical protein
MLAKSNAGSRPNIKETGLLIPSGTFLFDYIYKVPGTAFVTGASELRGYSRYSRSERTVSASG